MKKYDRLTEAEKIDMYIKAEPTLSIFEHVDDTRLKEKVAELEKKIDSYDMSARMLHSAIKEGYMTVEKTDTGTTIRMTKKARN